MELSGHLQPVRRRGQGPGAIPAYIWVLSYLSPYRLLFAGLLVCNLLLSLIEMTIPKGIQIVIDHLLPSRSVSLFYWLLAGIGALIMLMLALTVLRNHWQRVIQEQAARDLQLDVFRKLRELGLAYTDRHPAGDTLSLLNSEVAAIQSIYQSYLPKLIQYVLFVLVMTTVMFLTHWKLSLAVLPCFFTFYLFAPALSRKTALSGRKRAEDGRRMNQAIYDSLSALPEIRASGKEHWDMGRLLNRVAAYNESDVRTNYLALVRGSLRSLSISLGAVVLFVYGGTLVSETSLTVGEFVAFLLYYLMTIGYFSFILMSVSTQKVLLLQAEKIREVMRLVPDVSEPLQPVPLPEGEVRGELALVDVFFAYPGRPEALSGFNLLIRAGERTVIVGASGCGKSTVLKLLGRFYDPSGGEIRLDGVPLNRMKLEQLRGAVGYVFQDTLLFHASVKDNIRLGNPEASDEEVKAAAVAARADPFINQLPDGYDTIVGDRGDTLSGGQKQRIAIARMLLRNPPVVLLDEATSALDPVNEREVNLALDALLQGRTVVAVAHRLSAIRHYDRIVLLERGRIAEDGTYEELMSRRQLFYKLVQGRLEHDE
ncbi:MAG: hypothetical protein K0Q94_2037 [Paenibacillus sp.]|nr:hypothetical protein [Paenibacillus sp.]